MLFTSLTAHAQTYGDVQIRFGVFDMKPDRGERPTGVWRTGVVIIGKPLERLRRNATSADHKVF